MATNVPQNAPISKTSNASSQTFPASASQGGPSSNGDGAAQRRSGGSGSFGAGSSTRSSGAAPRSKQNARSQHKTTRRYRLADEDAIAESAAMRPFTNKKGQTSITHLMNFSLPPRPTNHQHNFHQPRYGKRNPTWGLGSGYHAVDKARYVHANYRFLVDPRRDYHAQCVDADVYLEWNSILQILASPQSQGAACPICLGDPVAPRMAKCGHIFCLHCLIRYMNSNDEERTIAEKRARWKPCPICVDTVYMSETRPVRWYTGQEGPLPVEGGDIVLRLVIRPTRSTLALPRESCGALLDNADIPWHHAADVMDFARVMKASENYMLQQFDEEIETIQQMERHDELVFGEDTEWTSKAIKNIRDAKERTKGIGNPIVAPAKPAEAKVKRAPSVLNEDSVPTMKGDPVQQTTQSIGSASWSASASQTGESSVTSTDTADTSDTSLPPQSRKTSALSTSISQLRAERATSQAPSDYYFYQALVHFYLAPLDIRILKSAFGDYSVFPSTILPQVEHISTGHVVDDELRKRAKYLSHLPHGCEVSFLECDWTDIVSPAVLERFKLEIEKRRKRHIEKRAREDKDRARAEKEEDGKRWAGVKGKSPENPSLVFDPSSAEHFQPLVAPSSPDTADTGAESASPLYASRKTNGSSFASLGSPSTSPNASRTVWGTAAIPLSSPTLAPIPLEAPSNDDGWLQGWEKDLLSEGDMVSQAKALSLAEGSSSKQPQGAGKKKRGKKITLMSTTARRGA